MDLVALIPLLRIFLIIKPKIQDLWLPKHRGPTPRDRFATQKSSGGLFVTDELRVVDAGPHRAVIFRLLPLFERLPALRFRVIVLFRHIGARVLGAVDVATVAHSVQGVGVSAGLWGSELGTQISFYVRYE